jgi:WD40 repeat protein
MISSVEFALDGRTPLTAGLDGTVRLWTAADRPHPVQRAALTGVSGGLATVLPLSAPGAIATLSNDATVEIWHTDLSWALAHACAHVRDTISRAQWARHFPGLDYRLPCAGRT